MGATKRGLHRGRDPGRCAVLCRGGELDDHAHPPRGARHPALGPADRPGAGAVRGGPAGPALRAALGRGVLPRLAASDLRAAGPRARPAGAGLGGAAAAGPGDLLPGERVQRVLLAGRAHAGAAGVRHVGRQLRADGPGGLPRGARARAAGALLALPAGGRQQPGRLPALPAGRQHSARLHAGRGRAAGGVPAAGDPAGLPGRALPRPPAGRGAAGALVVAARAAGRARGRRAPDPDAGGPGPDEAGAGGPAPVPGTGAARRGGPG